MHFGTILLGIGLITVFYSPETNGCTDKIANCGSFVNPCNYQKWAKINCAKHCGFCKSGSSCARGWSFYPRDKSCMKVIGANDQRYRFTWDHSNTFCSNGNGRLVVIQDKTKNDFVRSLIKQSLNHAWIGLRNINSRGFAFRWVDGIGLLGYFHPWRQGQPDDYRGQEKCVTINVNGQWNDLSCGQKVAHVCEKTSTARKHGCGPGWSLYSRDNKCIKSFTDPSNRVRWQDAGNRCKSKQARLVIIRDEAKNAFVKNFINTVYYAWMGLVNTASNGFRFQWVDQSSLGPYHPWRTGQPDNYRNNEKCITIDINGQWNDFNCNMPVAYVCEKNAAIIG